jgi:hypothetical protein
LKILDGFLAKSSNPYQKSNKGNSKVLIAESEYKFLNKAIANFN